MAGVLVLGAGAAVSLNWNKATPVLTARVATQDIVAKVTANGKIQAENKVELSALVQGQIVNLAVREGDQVKKGDFLLQIDQNRAAAEEAGSSAALKASLADRDSAKDDHGPGRARFRPGAAELRGADHLRGRLPEGPVGAWRPPAPPSRPPRTAWTRCAPASAPTATRSRRRPCARPSTGS